MLFFQAALLAGYAYGHAGIRVLGIRRHALLHGVIVWLPLLLLPIGVDQARPRRPTSRSRGCCRPWARASVCRSWSSPRPLRCCSAGTRRSAIDRRRSLLAVLGEQRRKLRRAARVSDPLRAGDATRTADGDLEDWLRDRRRAADRVRGQRAAARVVLTDVAHHEDDGAARAAADGGHASAVAGVVVRAVDVDARRDDVPVHRRGAGAAALGAAARVLSAHVHRRLRLVLRDACIPNVRRLLPSVLLPLVLLIVSEAPAALWVAILIHVLAFTRAGDAVSWRAGARSSRRAAPDRVLSLAGRRRRPRRRVQHAGRSAGVHVGRRVPAGDRVRLPGLRAEAAVPRRARQSAIDAAAGIRGRPRGRAARRRATGWRGAVPDDGVSRRACADVLHGAKHNTARFSIGVVGLLAALAIGNAVAPAGGGQTLYADRTFFGVYRVRTDTVAQFRLACSTGRPCTDGR